MTRRERLMATLQGKPVDRPAVCFYEINGFTQDATNTANPLNIFVDPSWQPLLELARTRSESIPMEQVGFRNAPPDPLQELLEEKAWVDAAGSHFVHVTARVGSRTFTYRSRRDPDVATCWIFTDIP